MPPITPWMLLLSTRCISSSFSPRPTSPSHRGAAQPPGGLSARRVGCLLANPSYAAQSCSPFRYYFVFLFQILRLFYPQLAPSDSLTAGQFYAVLRLIVHVQNGKEVDESLVFSQRMSISHFHSSQLPFRYMPLSPACSLSASTGTNGPLIPSLHSSWDLGRTRAQPPDRFIDAGHRYRARLPRIDNAVISLVIFALFLDVSIILTVFRARPFPALLPCSLLLLQSPTSSMTVCLMTLFVDGQP